MKTQKTTLEAPQGWAHVKPLAQYMEALRADERVRFSGLPRTEAGLQPAENKYAEKL